MTIALGRKLYDITMNLYSGFPVWPGDSPGKITVTSSVTNRERYTSSEIHASLHWGTHVDAPHHLYEDKWTIDQIPLDVLVGDAQVIEIPQVRTINANLLERFDIKPHGRIIFKTRNSDFWQKSFYFRDDFTALTPDAAHYLVELKTKLVGIDYFSLDVFTALELPVHRILYKENIIGVELLDLREIRGGDYQLICLPIKIRGGDGAPARVTLLE